MFSALKLHGKPLYRLARKGIEVERKEREVKIFKLQIMEINLPRVCFQVSCSKGTYIRSLGKDIGKKIGCGAHLLSLKRIRSGLFTLEGAISWERLMNLSDTEELSPWMISLKEALPRLPEVIGDERLVKKIRLGKKMFVRDLSFHTLPAFEKGQWLKMTSPEEGLVAILRSEMKGSDIERTDPELVAFQSLRVFHQQKTITH
jgi:tRNA pseudouridine55 synthase